jgi:uncharacterized repeat protein (TIGR02543 family)
LYAVWESTSVQTLNFSYGIGIELSTDSAGNYIYSKNVQYGEEIGELPSFTTPSVEVDGKTYNPYYNGYWYKTPIIDSEQKITKDTVYWSNYASIAYLLFYKMTYTITFDLVTHNLSIPKMTLEYNDNIVLPTPALDGYEFKGWYTEETWGTENAEPFKLKKMPPFNVYLKALWELKK